MAIYEFASQLNETPRTSQPAPGPELNPHISPMPPSVFQLSDVQQGRSKIYGSPLGAEPDYAEEFLIPGFWALDEAMKTYWSGLRVPTKDSYRFMRVKVAGGDKSILIWRDQLQNGRVRFPVASLNRGGHEFNKEKFSPPILTMQRRYTSSRMDRVALVRRPVPFLVKYTLTVWSAWKRDADYILYQVLTRFNPLAEFVMSDGHIRGSVQLRFEGSSDVSEKEVGFDQKAKVRYEFSMTAEAWLPLPEIVVPTILGRVSMVRDNDSGEPLMAARGKGPYFQPVG